MSHIAIDELLDLAEGSRAESDAVRLHLGSCASCRDRLADVRQTLAALVAVDPVERGVPEPSPLFWEHLSARVNEAVAADAPPTRWGGAARWLSWQLVVPAGACVAALLAVTVSIRTTSHVGSSASSTPADVASQAVTNGQATDVISDPTLDGSESWSVMTDLASELDWDAAIDAGLTPAGGVDRALFDLSPEARLELQRLLKEELARSGA